MTRTPMTHGHRKIDNIRNADRTRDYSQPREVRINVPVTLDQRHRWRQIAKREGMTVTEMVRYCVESHLWPSR